MLSAKQMIICHLCHADLKKTRHFYQCSKCEAIYHINDGIPCFFNAHQKNIETYDIEQYREEINKILRHETSHFWFKIRRHFIETVFHKYISKDNSVIEVGAGTGSVAKMLLDIGYNVSIGEIHDNGIQYIKNLFQQAPIYQFDILHNPFLNHFDVVGLFDVLEHIEDDNLALQEIYRMLSKQGQIVLTVPAHMWLWCEDDEISGHHKRYEQKGLKKILENNGFEIIYMTNFFIAIVPLLYFRTKVKSSEDLTINVIVNAMLYMISKIEHYFLNFFTSKIGGSILVVAKKVAD